MTPENVHDLGLNCFCQYLQTLPEKKKTAACVFESFGMLWRQYLKDLRFIKSNSLFDSLGENLLSLERAAVENIEIYLCSVKTEEETTPHIFICGFFWVLCWLKFYGGQNMVLRKLANMI